MGNHYHLVLRTKQANLSRMMRHINGEYTRAFNKRHALTGHVFQGRFKAILVDSDSYFLELCRYVELNPVRAGLAGSVRDWPWSSYKAHVGDERSPTWLSTEYLHDHILSRDALTAEDHQMSARLYAQMVEDGLGVALWPKHLRHEIFLGSEEFVANMQSLAEQRRSHCEEIPQIQRECSPQLKKYFSAFDDQQESVRRAYTEGGFTMSAIAKELGLSLASVSRMIGQAERARKSRSDLEAAARPGTLQDLTPCKT